MTQSTSTIKPFLGENFLLENSVAEILFHEYAKDQPIIDYHCHLPPDQIALNHGFANLTKIWLDGDHYKWRAMRTLGISEEFITGAAPDQEKFTKWASAVPYTIRNPLFHWTHLELKRYFGVDRMLNEQTALEIFNHCSALLNQEEYSTQNLLQKMNVEIVCSTDDPIDDLQHHRNFQAAADRFRLLPAFRPDKAILIQREQFIDYIRQLGEVVDREINSLADLLTCLQNRIEYFHALGCRLSDHGLEQVPAAPFTDTEADKILQKRLAGQQIYPGEALLYSSAVLYHLGKMYASHKWTMQLHLGALRNNSSRMKGILGPDTGFDSIGDFSQAAALSRFLNRLDEEDTLPKTILYNLNPSDNEVMATMTGNFNDGSVRGKIQFGSGWWFLDQKDGMEKQMNALSNMGLLSCFVGMLTDSRSFMSFPRHEYFRRILCNLIGKDVHNGELPNDLPWLGSIVQDICYRNAKRYFEF